MRRKSISINTHGTLITMTIVLRTANPTKSTFSTMKRVIAQPHPQITHIAVIFRKGHTTIRIHTLIGTSLAGMTLLANNISHHEPIHLSMQPIRQFIMADTTAVDFTAAWGYYIAFSLIVDTWNGSSRRHSDLERLYIILTNFSICGGLLEFMVVFLLKLVEDGVGVGSIHELLDPEGSVPFGERAVS